MAEHDSTRTNGDGTDATAVGAAPAGAATVGGRTVGGRTVRGGTVGAATVGAPRRAGADPITQVRAADLEPYTGLGYLSKLFRLIAVFLVVLLAIEVGTGLYREGSAALPTLLSEASRLIVLAGLLWGVGDLANLLIDVGHDVRAARILLGRQVAHMGTHVDPAPDRDRGVERAVEPVAGAGHPAHVADRADPELHP